jgi:two-component system OmpR family response regulator
MSATRLLYAEDDPDTREMICIALETEGFKVVCPADLRELLRLAKDESWDLFMLDTWMPQISGFELCSRIRKFDSRTPIVFYSAAARECDKRAALECGACDYIVKPVAFEVLVKRLNAAVDSSLSN